MVHYDPVLTTFDAEQFIQVLIEVFIKLHGLPDSIVIDLGLLFTSEVLVISLLLSQGQASTQQCLS